MIESRLATSADIDEYYDQRPRESLRAYVVLLDGKVAGLIGIARLKNHARCFSEFKPELRPYLRCMTILRTIKKAMVLVKESRVPVVALSTPEEPESIRIIERLGFIPWKMTPMGEVYKWPR